jgi:AcrR family transcriptional regulator
MSDVATDGRSVRAMDQRRMRKAEILKAAQNIISQKGYADTSIADILEAADISRGTFYIYFESREAVFQELIDGFIRQLMERIISVRKEDGDPVQLLFANVKRVVDLLFDNRELTVILLREAVAHDRSVDQKLHRLYSFLHQKLANALANGAEWGLIRHVDKDVVSLALIGSIKEVLYQFLVVRKDEKLDRDTISRELLSFALQGLR